MTGREASADRTKTIETHLAKIGSDASLAIKEFAAVPFGESLNLPPEIMRFLAWQAARTPGWMELEQRWVDDPPFDPKAELCEPPPPNLENVRDRLRPMCLEEPGTGERREVTTKEEFDAHRELGWRWVLTRDDHLEMLHVQAWYFQVRHFPHLSWVRLQPPNGELFITSDRGVAWVADGIADAPPAALRHPTAQVIAPLTRTTALVARHGENSLNVTPRDVNRLIACLASDWIAGPTREIIHQALSDRDEIYQIRRTSQHIQ